MISLFKLLIIFLLPLTGDEAYFIKWGQHLDWGYYDHPPMVGWLIYLMSHLYESHITYRLFSFLTTFVIAYSIYSILRQFDTEKEKALFPALLLLLSPADVLLSLFTNDVPLLLFGTLGVLFYLKGMKYNRKSLILLAGIFFGLSFLSKYFAVFLIAGTVLYTVVSYRQKALSRLAILLLGMLPFVMENLYFNYHSCWNNIMFNFFARTEDLHYNLSTLLGYFAILLYLLTPWGIYYIARSRKNFQPRTLLIFVTSLLSVGLTVFLLVSLKKKIGLHWLLLFIPYLFMLFYFVKEEYKGKLAKYTFYFTYLHIAIIVTVLLLPVSLFEKHKKYSDIILYTHTDRVCQKLQPYDPLFTTGYTSAAVLSYYCNKKVGMLMNNSKYGRMDDKLIDIRSLLNKKLYIFFKKTPRKSDLEEIFSSVNIETFTLMGAKFHLAVCEGLNLENYRKKYLDIQKKKFYKIPSWLPNGKCYFLDRYYASPSMERE
jgi:hypothetical protein